jgi:hypothetical protein
MRAGRQLKPRLEVALGDWIEARDGWYVSSGAPQSGRIGRRLRDIGYGYQLWSASVGNHQLGYAAGLSGQLIALLDELDIIIVTTADPFCKIHGSQARKHEKAVFNLAGEFIESLPSDWRAGQSACWPGMG